MFYLTGNSDNVVYTSVSAVKELSSPTYLMSLTHSQTGRKWSFIPQNITPQSGTPFNQRYDLFNFDLVDENTPEDLTGGTKAWYLQTPPSIVYQDLRYSGTSKGYLSMLPIVPNVFGATRFLFDFDNPNEAFTAGTMTLNGISLTSIIFTKFLAFPGNIWFISGSLQKSTGLYNQSGELQITVETNLNNTYSYSYYVTSFEKIDAIQPWKYYGYDIWQDAVFNGVPDTYLETPKIRVDEIGEFRYAIYEQANPINLNTSLAYKQLEVGLAYITEGFTDIFYESSDPSDVYNP